MTKERKDEIRRRADAIAKQAHRDECDGTDQQYINRARQLEKELERGRPEQPHATPVRDRRWAWSIHQDWYREQGIALAKESKSLLSHIEELERERDSLLGIAQLSRKVQAADEYPEKELELLNFMLDSHFDLFAKQGGQEK